MAAPTKPANVKKALANSEPSTHGTKRTWVSALQMSAFGGKADIKIEAVMSAFDPKRTSVSQPPDIFQATGIRTYNAAKSPCETRGGSTWTKLSFSLTEKPMSG